MTHLWERKGHKDQKGNWVVTVYEKGRSQNQNTTSAVSRGRRPWMPQPTSAQDSTSDWKKDLSKHKRKLSQGSKGDFFPEQRLIARWKNADRSTLLHESGHAFLSMEMALLRSLLSSMSARLSRKPICTRSSPAHPRLRGLAQGDLSSRSGCRGWMNWHKLEADMDAVRAAHPWRARHHTQRCWRDPDSRFFSQGICR